MKSIVSVSRRTDIPAFYAPWFMNRVRSGHVCVPNPFNPRQVSTIGLTPAEVACFVFWTRAPRPLLPHLDELEARGYGFYFHVTLTGLPPVLEPHSPPVEEALAAIGELARRLGPRRVIWRFDPLILSPLIPVAATVATFTRLADGLAGRVGRVVTSFARPYRQVERRLRSAALARGLDPAGFALPSDPLLTPQGEELAGTLAGIAAARGLTLTSCAEKADLTPLGIQPGRCIDADLISELFGIPLPPRKDSGQRPECGCHRSVDIGTYGTCRHGCLYCYAAVDRALVHSGRHDPSSPFLIDPPKTSIN